MAYTLREAINNLSSTPKPYSFYKHAKLKKPVLFIGALPPPNDVTAALTIAGAKEPVANGKVHWSEQDDTMVFVTGKGGTSFKGTMKALCSGSGVKKVRFNNEPAENTGEDTSEESDGEGNDGEGSSGSNNPPPQTATNPDPLNQPPNRPPPQPPNRNQQPNQPPNQNQQPPQNQPPPRQRVAPRQRGVAALSPRSLSSTFSPSTMESVKKAADRGGLKGMGDFGKVFKGVESLQKIEAKLRGPSGALPMQNSATLLQAYDTMLNNVTGYIQSHPGEPKDNVIKLKLEFCRKTEAALRLAKTQLKYSAKYDRLNTLSQKGNLTEDEETEAEQTRAELLLLTNEEKQDTRPTTGSSDVRLIRDDNGKVAYVFKSIDGESNQMQLAKGEGTAHEVLTSKLSDVLGTFGFNTGFPKTSLATLPLSDGENRPRTNQRGALVEGISGSAPSEMGEIRPKHELLRMAGLNLGAIDQFIKEQRAKNRPEREIEQEVDRAIDREIDKITPEQRKLIVAKMNIRLQRINKVWDENTDVPTMEQDMEEVDLAESVALVQQVPPTQMQQVLLSGVLSSSADIKWSNVMVDGDKARPFDGGGNMMSAEQMRDFQRNRSGKVDPLIGNGLLYLPDRKTLHPGATAPLDPQLKTQLLNIDPNVVEQEMTLAVQKVKNDAGGLDNALGDSNVQMSVASIVLMQEAVREAAPNDTMEQILTAFNLKMKNWMLGTDFPNAPAH